MMSWPTKLVLIVLGTAVYLALAVIGWGGPAAFFSHPARIALTLVVFALAVASFAVIGVLDAWLPAYTERHEFWTFGGDAVRWLGVVIFAAGGALRLWPVYVLGNRFSGLVAIQQGHTLVTDGIYRVIRHPSYLGLLLNSLGWALAFRSGVGLLLTAVTLVPLVARIRAEERLLQSQFGAEYDAYRARTSRLVPGLY
jgi:protein-S-isoprenylcysteine O-methyltransferase Ste14